MQLRGKDMTNGFFLDGTAVLDRQREVGRFANLSASSAIAGFMSVSTIGEMLALQVLDRARIAAHVRWVRDKRVVLAFTGDDRVSR